MISRTVNSRADFLDFIIIHVRFELFTKKYALWSKEKLRESLNLILITITSRYFYGPRIFKKAVARCKINFIYNANFGYLRNSHESTLEAEGPCVLTTANPLESMYLNRIAPRNGGLAPLLWISALVNIIY